MSRDRLRQQVAAAAAKRMYERHESFHQAKLAAARELIAGWIHPKYIPNHREIRAELAVLTRLHESHDARLLQDSQPVDRFAVFAGLLTALETVTQSPRSHPEGDALYHSLQVFQLAREELPYDEEFLLAALLHDVGKAIDPENHVIAALATLDELVTDRTLWLIEHHPIARQYLDNTLGQRARRRLEESEYFEELLTLARCDRLGRKIGVRVPEIEEALAYIQELDEEHGE